MIFFSWLEDIARSIQLMFNHTLLPSERFVDTLTSKKTKLQISSTQSVVACIELSNKNKREINSSRRDKRELVLSRCKRQDGWQRNT